MSAPTFTASGLTTLSFANGGMGGSLAASGNVVVADNGPIQTYNLAYSPPGSGWTAVRTLGNAPRLVRWDVQLVATSESAMNSVENAIDAHCASGALGTLVCQGRTSSYARIVPEQTRRIGPRRTLAGTGGYVLQRWQLAFQVLWPKTGSSDL